MINLEIKKLIQKATKQIYPDLKLPDFKVERAEEKYGDYASNIAMILAKKTGEGAEGIAEKIINTIGKTQMIKGAEVAKPGFINFKIALPYWQKKILEIIQAGEEYAKSDLGKDLKINIEFISANPTGPLTLGNGRGGYLGDVLANVFSAFGAQVEREYYINDSGNQIIFLGHSVLKDDQAQYKGAYIDEIAPKIKSRQPAEAGYEAAVILMEEYIKKTIAKMGIKFDHWFSEREMVQQGIVAEMIKKLGKLQLTYPKEGALWLRTSKFGDDKDRVLVTSQGEITYFASDIAYHFDKIRRGYNLLIDFWGADHHGYIKRIQSAVEVIRRQENWSGQLKIIICQFVRLLSQGKEVKMSKRLGSFVTFDELINKVGPDVSRFFFLQRAADTHLDFDLDLAKQSSQKNPVYYVQYAYARTHSILAKCKMQNVNLKMTNQNLKFLKESAEIDLIKELTKLPELVEEIVGDYHVQKLPLYAIELANAFHKFYEQCPIIQAENDQLKTARLNLLKATQTVLKNVLDLMGITAPKKM